MTVRHIRKTGLLLVLLAFAAGLAGCATPLESAAGKGDIKEMERLIAAGANVNETSTASFTALHYAALSGQVKAARLLVEKGADVNAKDMDGVTPLHFATSAGHVEFVRLLIKNGADIGIATPNTGTALELAKRIGHSTIVRILEKAEADAEARESGRTDTASSPQPSNMTGNAANNGAAQTAPKPFDELSDIPVFNAAPREHDLAVVIGIEKYQDIQAKSDFSKSDASIMKDYLKALGFKDRNIQFLVDERATRSGMEKSIEGWLPNRVKKESTVFVYYSGHGAPDSAKGDGYMVPYDGDPNYLEQTGYSLRRLTEHLAKLDAREVIVLLDSCFSGAGGRSVLAQGARPLVMNTENLSLKDNIIMMTATRAAQISMSSPEKGHGLFTYHFLKALKDGKKDMADIYVYLKPLVEDDAKELNAEQSPTISSSPERIKGRFVLVR